MPISKEGKAQVRKETAAELSKVRGTASERGTHNPNLGTGATRAAQRSLRRRKNRLAKEIGKAGG